MRFCDLPVLPLRPLLLLAACCLSGAASAELRFQFEDDFKPGDRHMLTQWISETAQGLARLVGDFPFDVHVHFYRRESSGQPVPWGHTRRGPRQSIHLYVDPRFTREDFRRDWTAAHELSHLVFPYLGSEHMWFAEGFASYMQYQIMMAMGVITPGEAEARYQERIGRASARFGSEQPFVSEAPRLRSERDFPTLYWGGAVYFLRADALLREQDHPGLIPLLRDYLACCRSRFAVPAQVTASLDSLLDSTLLTSLLQEFERSPGFPHWPMALPDSDARRD